MHFQLMSSGPMAGLCCYLDRKGNLATLNCNTDGSGKSDIQYSTSTKRTHLGGSCGMRAKAGRHWRWRKSWSKDQRLGSSPVFWSVTS